MRWLIITIIIFILFGCDLNPSENSGSDYSKWFNIDGDSAEQEPKTSQVTTENIEEPPIENHLKELSLSEVMKGTYAIYIQDNKGDWVQGSGFLIEKNLLVTNFHVVEGFRNGLIRNNDKTPKYNIDEILKIDTDNDIAILRVEGIESPQILPFSEKIPNIGDPIKAVGCPKGLEATVCGGIISQYRERNGANVAESGAYAQLFQIDADINHGSSGGPIVNEKGHVVGIAVSGLGDGMNYAIPARFIITLNKGTL
jgi:S1-C subfamily serine protease